MAEKKKTYRTFIGFVKYPVNESEAGGKDVRNFVIRQVGFKEQAADIRATLWPSHDSVALDEGDLVAAEGSFAVNKTKDKEGEPVTYFNLSVSQILVLGTGDRGVHEETASTRTRGGDDSDGDDDEIPY